MFNFVVKRITFFYEKVHTTKLVASSGSDGGNDVIGLHNYDCRPFHHCYR